MSAKELSHDTARYLQRASNTSPRTLHVLWACKPGTRSSMIKASVC